MNKLMKWSIIATTSMPLLSFAQPFGGGQAGGVNTSRIQSVEGIIGAMNTAIDWIQNILLVLAVILVLYSAFLYITSAGDETKVGTAKKALLYAAIGIAIVLLAYSITPILEQLLQAG
jgi:uncharacterized membrane protein